MLGCRFDHLSCGTSGKKTNIVFHLAFFAEPVVRRHPMMKKRLDLTHILEISVRVGRSTCSSPRPDKGPHTFARSCPGCPTPIGRTVFIPLRMRRGHGPRAMVRATLGRHTAIYIYVPVPRPPPPPPRQGVGVPPPCGVVGWGGVGLGQWLVPPSTPCGMWVWWVRNSVRKIMSKLFQIMTCSFCYVSDLEPTQTK